MRGLVILLLKLEVTDLKDKVFFPSGKCCSGPADPFYC